MSSAQAVAAALDSGGHRGLGVEREGQPELEGAASREAVKAGEMKVEGNSVGSAGDAGAAMVGAAGEDVAGVKVEGKVVAAVDVAMKDAAPEGGVAVASDSLYATESAGMVAAGEDGPAEDMQTLNEGVEQKESLEVGAGGLQGEEEKHLVQTEPVVAETTESPAEYAEAEFNTDDRRARYCLPPLDKDGFRVSALVWSKLKGHPWWPGEIFDPSSASEIALKNQKKDCHLVAYCGDTTFSWCEESQLKPFMTNYSQMEKQSTSDAFINSVNHALEELSRRILSGMSCSCLPEELSENGMSYMVENSGLRHGVTCSTVNQAEILDYFSPVNLLHYVKSLALSPGQGGDLLHLVIACSQLTSFYRSKGCPELASFQTGSALTDNYINTSPSKSVMSVEATTTEVQPSQDKPKRGRGRPRKRKPEDDLELMGKKTTSNLNNTDSSNDHGERRDDFDSQKGKKRSLNSFEDSETKTETSSFGGSFKIGDCMRRAASQLTEPSSISKPQNELTVHNRTAEVENGEFDISSDNDVSDLPVKKRANRRRMHRHHVFDSRDLLSNLCSVATEPMNGCSLSVPIITYLNDFRNYAVSVSTEMDIIESEKGGNRTNLLSPELEATDHMQDAYWSGVSLHNDSIGSFGGANTNMRPRRRRRPSSRYASVPSPDLPSPAQHLQLGTWSPKKQIQMTERPIIHVDEKMLSEIKPTALVLSFGRSTALPSEMDLIRMFSRYGPLKETETEVHMNSNTVKVVFKKRVDAERAFSVAGKCGSFGHSLSSFRLVNLPFSLGKTESNCPELYPEVIGTDVPAPRGSGVPLGAEQIDSGNKAEAAKAPTVEHVEMVKQVEQGEHIIRSALHTEGTSEESPEVLLDTRQIEVAGEALKDGLVCGDFVV